MDQKNTIVKCNATTCLYNYKGVCDQYVIDLDMYGQCKDYIETATEEDMKNGIIGNFKGQRIKGNFIEDEWVDPKIVKEVCKPFAIGADLSNDKI